MHPVAEPTTTLAKPLALDALADWLTSPSARPRLVVFWAQWCAPCVAELPRLRAFGREHPDIEVQLVNLDTPAIQASRLVPLLQGRDVAHLLLDGAPSLPSLRGKVPGWRDEIPFTLAIRRDGTVAGTWTVALDQATLTRAHVALTQ